MCVFYVFVIVNGEVVGEIDCLDIGGILVLIGIFCIDIEFLDSEFEVVIEKMVCKIVELCIFEGERSVEEVGVLVLVVS